MSTSSEPRVLIVEDNPGDIFLLQESLRECQMAIDLLIAQEVEAAIQLLKEDQGAIPRLALIDLHLPKKDGKSLLLYLRDQPELAKMPCVILSSSQRISDRDACLA
jgi:CheY-like chemotaxis protein